MNSSQGLDSSTPAAARLFCFGLGYSARRVIARAGDVEASGATLTAEAASAWRREGVAAFAFEDAHDQEALVAALSRAEILLVSAPPDEAGDPALARFARAVDAFPTPIGLFNNLVTDKDHGDALDLKKGGIFPIVHGVRALALERGFVETGTTARIARLAEEGALSHDLARELTQALHYLMTLRLDAQLAAAASGSSRS